MAKCSSSAILPRIIPPLQRYGVVWPTPAVSLNTGFDRGAPSRTAWLAASWHGSRDFAAGPPAPSHFGAAAGCVRQRASEPSSRADESAIQLHAGVPAAN